MMSMHRLLHVVFALLAGLLVARAVVETVRADERRVRAVEELSNSLDDQLYLDSDDPNGRVSGSKSSTSIEPADLASSLNCSDVAPFGVAEPARSGFVCFSESRAAHPLTAFIYEPGVASEVLEVRTRRACAKALSVGQSVVYVLTMETHFVYTTSPRAVAASPLSDRFMALDARTCG